MSRLSLIYQPKIQRPDRLREPTLPSGVGKQLHRPRGKQPDVLPTCASSRFEFRHCTRGGLDRLIDATMNCERAYATAHLSLPYSLKDRHLVHQSSYGSEVRCSHHWIIHRAIDERPIGYAALDRIDDKKGLAQLQFWFSRGCGSRLETEAERTADSVNAILAFASVRLVLVRVYAFQLVRQPRIGFFLSKVGMTQEGFVQRRIHRGGLMESLSCWAIDLVH